MRDYSELKSLLACLAELDCTQCVLDIKDAQALIADLENLRGNHEHVIALNHKQFGDAIRKNAEYDQLKAENEALRQDLEHSKRDPLYSTRLAADRYRWLRGQTWDTSPIAVVVNPKRAVKLGYDCPSGIRLDQLVDSMRLEVSDD